MSEGRKRRTLPDGYTPLEGEPVEIVRLGKAVPFNGDDVDELRYMRRPNADDLIVVEENDYEGTFANLYTTYRLTGIPVSSLRRMDAHDARRVEDLLVGFLRRGPATGDSGSQSSRRDSDGNRSSSDD